MIPALLLLSQSLMRRNQLGHRPIQAQGCAVQMALHAVAQSPHARKHLLQQLIAPKTGQFGRGGWRGCTQVGHEIGNGEIGLVPHPTNNRDRTGGDQTCQTLIVESPEILQTAAPAYQQERIDLGPLNRSFQCLSQSRWRFCTLNWSGINNNAHMRSATLHRSQHISQSSGRQGSDDAYTARQACDWALAFRLEQTFALQLPL